MSQHPGRRSTTSDDWTAPGAYEVSLGVHRIPLPMPDDGLRAVNVYAIEDREGLVLIDSGWGIIAARSALDRALGDIGASLRDVRRFLVTHAHRDHYTLAVLVRRELGTRISVGWGERAALEVISRPGHRLTSQVSMLRRAGAHELAERVAAGDRRVDPLPEGWELPDDWLQAGRLHLADRVLEIVPTPGHTQGHVVFHDQEAGLLFAGDHVLPHLTPSIGFEAVTAESPLGDYLQSLRRVRWLPDARLLPAHGETADSAHARIDELLLHHDRRLKQMHEAVVLLGEPDAHAVAAAILWTRRNRAFESLDYFNQMLAVTETVAHLELLVRTGQLLWSGRDVRLYRSSAPSD